MRIRSKGFTLIELLVVVVIILILVAILFPVFAKARDNARKAACVSNARQICIAMRMYQEDNEGCYPAWDWPCPGGFGSLMWNNYGYGYWMYLIGPYLKSEEVFVCPSAPKNRTYMEGPASLIPRASYGYNEYIGITSVSNPYYKNRFIRYPVETALVAECGVNLLFNDWGWYIAGDEIQTRPSLGDGVILPRGMMRIKYANGNINGRLKPRHEGEVIIYCDLHAKFMPLSQFAAIPVSEDHGRVSPYSSRRQRPLIHPGGTPL